jgi:hypothetical protein
MVLRRRKYLQSLPILTIPVVSGCSQQNESPLITLRMVRVINLSETELLIELTASDDTGTPDTLYTGQIGTQGPNAGDGEVVLQPSEIVEPLQYDYHLTVSGSQKANIVADSLESAYQSESSERSVGCVELSFAVRDPANEAEVWGDYTFWESCETAPGTVDPTTPS